MVHSFRGLDTHNYYRIPRHCNNSKFFITHSFLKFHAEKLLEDENTHQYLNTNNDDLAHEGIDDKNSISYYQVLFSYNNRRIWQKFLLVTHFGLTTKNSTRKIHVQKFTNFFLTDCRIRELPIKPFLASTETRSDEFETTYDDIIRCFLTNSHELRR